MHYSLLLARAARASQRRRPYRGIYFQEEIIRMFEAGGGVESVNTAGNLEGFAQDEVVVVTLFGH